MLDPRTKQQGVPGSRALLAAIAPWLLAPMAAAVLACGFADRDVHRPRVGEVQVRVERVTLDRGDLPVVILEEERGSRWLPIWIGSAEARSIAIQMADREASRPNTHDLARNLIEGLEASVLRVVVTELRSSTYYATLALRVRDEVILIDARPSDAIAIALRADAPIFVREQLFAEGGEDGTASESGVRI